MAKHLGPPDPVVRAERHADTTRTPARHRDVVTGYLKPIPVAPPDDDVREALSHLLAEAGSHMNGVENR